MSNEYRVTSKRNKGENIFLLRVTRYALLVTFLFCGFSAKADSIKISGVEIEHHKQYDNIFINIDEGIKPKAMLLEDRLVLDFKGAEVDKPQNIAVPKSDRVKSIRIGQFSKEPLIARVVFDLKRNIKYDTAFILGKDKLQVEVANTDDSRPIVSVKPEEKTEEPIKEVKAPKPKCKFPAHETAVKTTEKYPLRGKTIVVDPGHGGNDPGAMGMGGVWEKEINLKTARLLAADLRQMGARVYMTRNSDIKRSLKDIAEFANQINADVYIGVHFNSIENPKISGTETHYYSPQSYKLAERVHTCLIRGIRREDRGIKRTMLYTIHHTHMPAILVEPVYMTHFQDGLLIKSKSFQKEVARDIANGIKDFLHAD